MIDMNDMLVNTIFIDIYCIDHSFEFVHFVLLC